MVIKRLVFDWEYYCDYCDDDGGNNNDDEGEIDDDNDEGDDDDILAWQGLPATTHQAQALPSLLRGVQSENHPHHNHCYHHHHHQLSHPHVHCLHQTLLSERSGGVTGDTSSFNFHRMSEIPDTLYMVSIIAIIIIAIIFVIFLIIA